jgi:hypothetical protein
LLANNVKGQHVLQYTINNGLPNNTIYDITTDHNGYLWVCTPNGVARFNGYEWKTYDLTTGLPTSDVWGLTEDRSGRMWLWTIFNQIGYIKNDKYFNAKIPHLRSPIYPHDIRRYKDGIIFYRIEQDNSFLPVICTIEDDTLEEIQLPAEITLQGKTIYLREPNKDPQVLITADSRIFIITTTYIVEAQVENHGLKFLNPVPVMPDLMERLSRGIHFITNGYIVNSDLQIPGNSFSVTELATGKTRTITIPEKNQNEVIQSIYTLRNSAADSLLFITTTSAILKYTIGKNIQLQNTYSKSLLLGNAAKPPVIDVTFDDAIWGKCISSRKNGVFLVLNELNEIKKDDKLNLDNYSLKGLAGDSRSLWWNKEQRDLIIVDDQGNKHSIYQSIRGDVNTIIPFSKDTFLICGSGGSNNYWLNINKRTVSECPDYPSHIFSGLKVKTNLFIIAMRGVWVKDLATGQTKKISDERYAGICYDKLCNRIWLYNQYKITTLLCDSLYKTQDLDLQKLGIKYVSKICSDTTYGNILIKDADKVQLIDPEKMTSKPILGNFNTSNSKLYLQQNHLIVAGTSGIIESCVTGKGIVSFTKFYPNLKRATYLSVYDVFVSPGKIILNTDQGICYAITEQNKDTTHFQSSSQNAPLIIKTISSTQHYNCNDTINLKHGELRILADIIAATGNGKVSYKYKIEGLDSNFRTTSTGELFLSADIIPGKYYQLTVVPYDDAIIFPSKTLWLYIEPYWWQKITNHAFFNILLILLILTIITITVIITNKIVSNRNKRKNVHMDLELKSIYAQINPHFIFNTLGGVMYLIKKKNFDQAYGHLSRFSKLLRSYLASSRNRFTTLAYEIENIENYILLQQMRFEDKFTYTITVDKSIDVEAIKIPALLIQPFIENAINHGLFHKKNNGLLQVIFAMNDRKNKLICTIEDNGIGRTASRKLYRESAIMKESLGDTMIDELIAIYNKYERSNISVRYTDKELPLTGTIVVISLQTEQNEK